MIVVDSSVWIDDRRDAPTRQVRVLREALDVGARSVAVAGLVRTELLQGVANSEVPVVAARFDRHPQLGLIASDYDEAAHLYRAARDRGTTVRSTIDCLIAAICIRLELPLLHNDADFGKLAAVSELQVVPV